MSRWISKWWKKRAGGREADLDDEIRSHLEIATRERMGRGESSQQARVNARRDLGNELQIKEATRESWGWASAARLGQDLRYALRQLRMQPGFAAIAVLTLALGIGANTAVFSLVNAVLLRPLPFAEPERLVVLRTDASAAGGLPSAQVTPADFVDWRSRNQSFDDMAALVGFVSFNLTGEGEPIRLVGARTTANVFEVLGLQAVAGRALATADDEPGAAAAAVLSERVWRNQLGADPAVIGRTVSLNDVPTTVVGVMPNSFQYPVPNTDVWVAGTFTPEEYTIRGAHYLEVLGRLKPGVSMEQAADDMDRIAAQLEQEYPVNNTGNGVALTPLHEMISGSLRPTLNLLLGIVGIVLLIACVNVAHLLLARGRARAKEIAMRAALGASRGRLVRQLMTESLLLAVAGAVAGAALARGAFWFLDRLIPASLAGAGMELDGMVLGFTAAVAVVTAVGFGVGPALAASRLDLNDVFKQGGDRGTTGGGRGVRGALVIVEVALSVVLLVAAGLLLRSYARLRAVDVGFPAPQLLTAETVLPAARYGDLPARSRFYDSVIERMKRLPGVEEAGYVNYPPLVIKGGATAFRIEGRPEPLPGEVPLPVANFRVTTQSYLPALGLPLIEGRRFDDRDRGDSPPVTIVNQTMARMFWPGESAVGRRMHQGNSTSRAPWMEVVGVVQDTKQAGVDVATEPEFYLPDTQTDTPSAFFWPQYLVVRTSAGSGVNPLTLAGEVRRTVAAVDPEQPVSNIRTMSQVVDAEFTQRNTQLSLVSGFALLALLLASVGLYGVLSYGVAQRTSEIGLRMALGAGRGDVIRMVLRRTVVLTCAGVGIGLGAALGTTRLLESFLYEIAPGDPVTFVLVAALLLGVALVACSIPARRAASIDPAAALRSE